MNWKCGVSDKTERETWERHGRHKCLTIDNPLLSIQHQGGVYKYIKAILSVVSLRAKTDCLQSAD